MCTMSVSVRHPPHPCVFVAFPPILTELDVKYKKLTNDTLTKPDLTSLLASHQHNLTALSTSLTALTVLHNTSSRELAHELKALGVRLTLHEEQSKEAHDWARTMITNQQHEYK